MQASRKSWGSGLVALLCSAALTIVLVPATALADYEVTDAFFTDVQDAGKYYYEPVYALAELGYVTGTTATTYSPDQTLTRGQLVAVLWRILEPEAYAAYLTDDGTYDYSAADSSTFSDVADGKYYTEAIEWAVAQGIAKGLTDTTFGPDTTCTFEQFCTFLARAVNGGDDATSAAVTDEEAASVLAAFSDGSSVGASYDNSVAYLVTAGAITGYTDGTIAPQEQVSRARFATLVYRMLDLLLADGEDDGDDATEDDEALTYTAYDVTYTGTGSFASDSMQAIVSAAVSAYFGNSVDVARNADGTYSVVVYFGGTAGYSSAIGDITVYASEDMSDAGTVVSQSDDQTYTLTVESIDEPIYCSLYVGGSMGMTITYAMNLTAASDDDEGEDDDGDAESGLTTIEYTLMYNGEDSSDAVYATVLGTLVDGEFVSGAAQYAVGEDGRYTLYLAVDSSVSALSGVSVEFAVDEDAGESVSSTTTDEGYLVYTLVLNDLSTVDATLGYTVEALGISYSFDFQLVFDLDE